MSPCPRCGGLRYIEHYPVSTVTLVLATCYNCGGQTELAMLGHMLERDHQPLPLREARKGSRKPRRTIHSYSVRKEAQ